MDLNFFHKVFDEEKKTHIIPARYFRINDIVPVYYFITISDTLK